MRPRPGPVLEIDTNVKLGQHNGLWTYTIGQGARLPGLAKKLFVAAKDHQKNAVYVASPESVPRSCTGFRHLTIRLSFFPLVCSQPSSVIHFNYHLKQILVDMERRAPIRCVFARGLSRERTDPPPHGPSSRYGAPSLDWQRCANNV